MAQTARGWKTKQVSLLPPQPIKSLINWSEGEIMRKVSASLLPMSAHFRLSEALIYYFPYYKEN